MEMPVERDEDWRYVHPEFDLDARLIPAVPGERMGAPAGAIVEPCAVSVDGFTIESVSGDGFTVTPGRDVAESTAPTPEDRIVALHEAFSFDGVEIAVDPGARTPPLLVDLQAVSDGAAVLPRVRVSAGKGSEVAVTVLQRSPDGVEALVAPAIEVDAGDGARVQMTVVQQWGDRIVAAARHRMRAGRDATVALAEAGFGGAYSRLHLSVDLEGDGSSADIVGAYFGDAEQTLDYRYFMRHAARSTNSEMFLKGAVADEARSVFTGLIRIEPEGQKTSAHQTNRNLVLSDGAEAHSVPNLEILADDVRCGHGSAVGPLDEEQRYYLMSRGLERSRADRLQVKGFFEEALARFVDDELHHRLRDLAMDKYSRTVA